MVGCGESPPHAGGWVDPESGVRLVVAKHGSHRYLTDHERELFVVSPGGGYRRIELYPCVGVPVRTNVYRAPAGRFVLIDANGVWITVTSTGGVSQRWCWGKQPPADFVGSFRAGDGDRYEFEQGSEPAVYLFKDPPDGMPRGS